jgi:hypothetical protein
MRTKPWMLCVAVGALTAWRADIPVVRSDVDKTAASTRAMAALLRERAAQVDPAATAFIVNDRRAALIAEHLDEPGTVRDGLSRRFDYAAELINAGRISDALLAIEDLEQRAAAVNPTAWRQHAGKLLILKAVAFLRQGEQQNCNEAHTAQSCLLPIRGRGLHHRREGSQRAVEVLDDILAHDPDNLRARWLLNIAHMTLGQYPDKVAPGQLIPPSAFAAQYALPRFPDVAAELGVNTYGLSGGAILDDFDRDGRLDLMVSSIGFSDQLKLFHNEGKGRFEERSAAAGLTGETGGLNLLQADFDNDGWTDVLVLRGGWLGSEARFPMSLIRNNGDGTFADVTQAAGLLRAGPTQTATWLDYDGDGRLDLFVGYESSALQQHPCALFHNNGDGTFTDVAAQAGVDVLAFVKGVVSGDYDNDGRPDLYLSTGGSDNILFHNDGAGDGKAWHFTNVAAQAGVTEPHNSFPAAFFDYDNDGWLDIFVAGYGAMAEDVAADVLGLHTGAERGRLYHNRGNGTFANVTREAGLYRVTPGMGMNYGDLDNDGFLDLYIGTGNPDISTQVPNLLFRNDGGRRFLDVTTAVDVGHLQKGHAICFGDIDDDGDQDIFEQMGGAVTADRAYSALYENPGNRNAWLGLELEGVRANRSGIGARVKVTADPGQRVVHRTVGSGASFGASPLRLEIGLGRADRVRSVEIHWPGSGRKQTLGGLVPGHRYRVREGEGVRPVKR